MQIANGGPAWLSAPGRSFAVGGIAGLAAVLSVGLGSEAEPAAAQTDAACAEARAAFANTGGPQTFQVPLGVDQITIDAFGAQGGSIAQAPANVGTGGLGAAAPGTVLAVTPGETLDVVVGGAGGDVPAGTPTAPAPGGFGGGGDGGAPSTAHTGGGGGGASSVARGATVLVIAGGGGGGAHGGFGGDGGLSGTDGTSVGAPATGFGLSGGNGGAGGAGSGVGVAGLGGGPGTGGDGGAGGDGGGGGGGGAVGGGGGGGGTATIDGGGAGGGGGSSAALAGAGTQFQTGAQVGDGRVEIRYQLASCRQPVLGKNANRRVVPPAGKVRWTLRVRNRGNVPATNVRLCDVLNKRTTVVKRGGGKLVGKGKRICWTIRRLAPGEQQRRRFVTRVKPESKLGRLCNRAWARNEGGTGRAKSCVRVRGRSARVSPVTG